MKKIIDKQLKKFDEKFGTVEVSFGPQIIAEASLEPIKEFLSTAIKETIGEALKKVELKVIANVDFLPKGIEEEKIKEFKSKVVAWKAGHNDARQQQLKNHKEII